MATRKIRRQIVVLGGGGCGGYTEEQADHLLDDYILRLTGKRRPKVCFIPTASGDSPVYIRRFLRAMRGRAQATCLSLFKRDSTDPAKHLLAQDVIFVGGGNTANLLAVWRVHGVDHAVREAWRRGIILCGVSAGMICWFECSVTDSYGPLAALNDGLGLLPGSACPHYDGEVHRRPTFHRLIKSGFPAGVAADDGAAIHYVGRKIFRCVSSRPKARTYQVGITRGKVTEDIMPVDYLRGKI